MAQNKHKTKRRIISILFASIIALYVFMVPVGAVIITSRGEGSNFDLTAQSSFPMTVGFAYKSSPNSTYNYTLATDIGGYGTEYNMTLHGDDVVVYEYDELGEPIGVTRTILYEFGDHYRTDNQAYINAINGNVTGYYPLTLKSVTNSSNQETSSITLSANNIVYNRALLDFYQSSDGAYNLADFAYACIPTIRPAEMVDENKAIVGTLNISYDIYGSSGIKNEVAYSINVDTRTSTAPIHLLSVDNLLSFDVNENPRLLIMNYKAYWDVDYYEYTEPVDDSIVGTWVFNDTFKDVDTLNLRTFLLYSNEADSSIFGRFESELYPESNCDITLTAVSDATGYYYGVQFVRGTNDGSLYLLCGNSDSSTGFIQLNESLLKSGVLSIYKSASYEESALSFLQANATKQGTTATATQGTWQKVENEIVNEIRLTMPTYDTSGAFMSDTAQQNAQNIYFSKADTTAYVDSVEKLSFEDVDLTGWLGKATKGFLDFELWDNFTLGGVLAILVTIPLMIWVLKLFAGG